MNSSPLNTQVRKYLNMRFGLPDEQIDLMMPEFKKTLTQHLNSLKSAFQQNNLLALKEAAHTTKGALLNLGFSESAQLAQKIELESSAGNTMFEYSLLIDKIGTIVIEFIDEQ